ncbi:MAG: glutamate mutase L [Anaerolineales bacterium]
MESYLITDFGITHTRSVLLDVVEGQYRLIAGTMSRSTTLMPEADALLALERNVLTLENQTGRTIINRDPKSAQIFLGQALDGSGIGHFLATASSAGRSLEAVLVALMDDFSLHSAQRALTGTYVEILETLTLTDIATEEDRVNRILRNRPDVILVTGGTDDGNEDDVRDLVRLVELAIKLVPGSSKPNVLYAGNARLQPWVKKRLEDDCVIYMADNVRPALDTENLSSAKIKLANVFDQFLKTQSDSFRRISDMSRGDGIVPTAQSIDRLMRYLDTLDTQRGALHIDIGSGTSTLLAMLNQEGTDEIRSNLGLGHGAPSVLPLVDWRDVQRWVPFTISLSDLEAWALNKSIAPHTIPQTMDELLFEHAITREIIRALVIAENAAWTKKLPPFSPIILAGAVFTQGVPPGMAVLMALDALQPEGVVQLWADPFALAAALGAVSLYEPLAVVQIVDSGGFINLGTVFAPSGRLGPTRLGRMAVTITRANGEVITQDVSAGDIWCAPVPAGEQVNVSIKLARGLSLEDKREWEGSLRAGSAGLIFDMRGRPLQLPAGRRRGQTLANWYQALAGIDILAGVHSADTPAMDAMTALSGGIDDADFPDYNALPEGGLDPALAEASTADSAPEMPLPEDFALDDFDLPEETPANDGLDDLRRLR